MFWWDQQRGFLLIDQLGRPINCAACPCAEQRVVICEATGCSWLAEFEVEGDGFANAGCASCVDVFHQRRSVTYQGILTIGSTDWHWWRSAADVFGSPGSCGGAFDDREIHVILTDEQPGGDCYCQLRIRSESKGVVSDVFSPLDSFELDADRTLIIDGDDLNNPCTGAIEIRTQSYYSSSDCTAGNFLIYPNGE